LDQNEYLYVKAVYEHGSITKAARSLYISQPSLSTYISRLEQHLNVKLFEKSNGRLQLTYAGERYLDYGRQILALDEKCTYEMSNISKSRNGRLVLGTTNNIGIQTLPLLLAAFHRRFPEVQIYLKETTARELEEMIHHRELDMALLTVPFSARHTEHTVIRDAEVLLSVHKSHPLFQKAIAVPGLKYEFMDLHYLKDEPLILLNEGRRIRLAAEQLFSQIGCRPHALFETTNSIIAHRLAIANVAPTFITEDALDAFHSIKVNYYHVGNPRIIHQMICAYPSESLLDEIGKSFIAIAKEHFSNVSDKNIW